MRTQKAQGIYTLQQNQEHLNFLGEVKVPSFNIVSADSDLYYVDWSKKEFPLFARPCPVVPRHGFVDSRPISSPAEAQAVFAEAKKADPEAELVLMQYIKASHNAIWTPGHLTIGPDNDGATSGKNSISIRTTKKAPFKIDGLPEQSGIKAGDVPYLEFVRDSSWYAVQLRGGPDISDLGDDYLPSEVKVKQVVLAEGDLMEWEKKTKTFKPGTVVYHPGGSLSDHYGVHCKINEIPILTSREPKAGDLLRLCSCNPKIIKEGWCPKCNGLVAKIPELDMEEVLKGISQGINYSINYADAVKFLLGCLHNSSYFGKKESRLFGVALVFTVKLGIAACQGQARYDRSHKVRTQKWADAWQDLTAAIRHFNDARSRFYYGKWSPGFGGKAWATCADATAELWNLMVQLVRNKTKTDLQKVNSQFNVVVNCAHNNGWWFNKFISPAWFDISLNTPSAPLIAIGQHVYAILREDQGIGGIISEIEKTPDSKSASTQIVATETKFGPFSITHIHRHAKDKWPWVLTFQDGTTKRASCFLGIARVYLKAMGETVTKDREKEVREAIAKILKNRPVKSTETTDEWIIPALSKQHPQPEFLDRVERAIVILRNGRLHIQIKMKENTGYATKDVKMPDGIILKSDTVSMGGTKTPYSKLEVQPDGIYGVNKSGFLRLVVLQNYVMN